MRIDRLVIVTDAWEPQINGVVNTLRNTKIELERMGIEVRMITPQGFKTMPLPTYPEIKIALVRTRTISGLIEGMKPDALHIATEGPLGWAARAAAIKNSWPYTTAYHTRFPEYFSSRTRIPASWIYPLIRLFHRSSSAIFVPTPKMIKFLEGKQLVNLKLWTRGVDHSIFKVRVNQPKSEEPIFIFVGRVSLEKNIEAFLELDLPGKKIVVGDGPSMTSLSASYPGTCFLGYKTHSEIAALLNQADVFVFPSRTDTFGLVMVEAMACGLPVAAFPVEGPIDVIGDSGAGVLDEDLGRACIRALKIPKHLPVERAHDFTWEKATKQFYECLTPIEYSRD